MKCNVCGNELDDTAVFCPNCGTKAERDAEVLNDEKNVEVSENTADLNEVEEALLEVAKQTEDMPEEMAAKTGEERLGDIMEAADKIVDNTIDNASNISVPEETVFTEAVAPVMNNKDADNTAAVRVGKPAKKKYPIAKNPTVVTVFEVVLAIMFTAALFMAASIFTLAHSSFDSFYEDVVTADIVANIDFISLTTPWCSTITYILLIVLAVLMFVTLKKRKYAILNYVGIPTLINGLLFIIIAYFSEFIEELFDNGILAELFAEISESSDTGDIIVLYAFIMLGVGAAAVIAYLITSIIHKAVYSRKCRKAENAA